MTGISTVIDQLLHHEEQWHSNPKDIWGLPTGFDNIDAVTGGLHGSEVFLIAARTSQGKTSFTLQIASHVAFELYTESFYNPDPGVVMIWSPEMTHESMMMRMVSQQAEVDSLRIRKGLATEEERTRWRQTAEELRKLEPFLDVRAGSSVDVMDLVSKVSTQHRMGPPVRLVIIDYLQRIRSGIDNSPYTSANTISLEIKDMANDLNVPVILLSQVNREGSGKSRKSADEDDDFFIPRMHHIRDSGRIEEDADKVAILWMRNRNDSSPYIPVEEDIDRGRPAGFHIEKNRDGPLARVSLFFDDRITRFSDGSDYEDDVEIEAG